MKKFFVFFLSIFTLLVTSSFTTAEGGGSTAQLKITWYATHTVSGYSYPSKMKVFVDGQEVGESPVKDQQEKNTFTVTVPKGKHELKCVIWAQIKGTWEERLVANDYSFDWMYTESASFKKKNKRTIEFNVEKLAAIKH